MKVSHRYFAFLRKYTHLSKANIFAIVYRLTSKYLFVLSLLQSPIQSDFSLDLLEATVVPFRSVNLTLNVPIPDKVKKLS